MATRDEMMSLNKQSILQNVSEKHQYSNVNLNQSHKCLNVSLAQSDSKTTCNSKGFATLKADSKIVKDEKRQWKKSSSNNSHSKAHKSFTAFDEAEENIKTKRWKNDSTNATTTCSTLSLHIAAYENSIEGEDTVTSDKKGELKNDLFNGQKQLIINSTLDSFEFPRQQTDDVSDPAVMQFTASQQLLNPNQLNSSDNNQQGTRNVHPALVNFKQRAPPSPAQNLGTVIYGSSMDLSEYIKKSRVDNVLLKHGPRPKSYGTIALTSHHFIFQPAPSQNTVNNIRNDELWLLLRAVDIAVFDATMMNKGNLTLKCKNFMICSFEMEKPHDALLLAQSINALSNLRSPGHEFPYFYRSPFTVLDDGWNIYDVSQQFCELSTMFPDVFRLTSVNKDYHVCSSYPDKSIVVKGVGDDYLRLCATFRRDGRFPVVSFVDSSTKSILVRTSEPLLGPTNRRCIEDEAVHKAYLLNKNMGILIDTRSKSALASAKARGGGFESAFYYRSWNIIFLELPRSQDIQTSFQKVVETCNDYGNVNYHSRLNSSGWLPIIATVLSKAGVIAQSMHYVNPGYTHIVHGGESKDMTLMMTSLCAIILDPNARTLRGFQSLIEREWILGGHPFGERCSHSAYATGGGEEAPIFVCFLNCVFQMMHAYPTAFEFTDHFLINIFEHSYASEFGTFLYDSERDRHHAQLRKRTVSLWSYVNHPDILSSFMNPLYVPVAQPLWPVISGVIHVLWQRLFSRWNLTWDEADETAAIAAAAAEKVKKLQSHLRTLLNQRINEHSSSTAAMEEISNLKIEG